MSAPNATLQIQDNSLGLVSGIGGDYGGYAGVTEKSIGSPATVKVVANRKKAEELLGFGPMLDAVVQHIEVSGKPALALLIGKGANGSVGATTQTKGSGAGTVTGSAATRVVVQAKVTTGGALATAALAWSVNGGAYGTPVVTGANPWTYEVPGTFLRATFATGTYVLNEVYTFSTDGTVSQSGSGPLPTAAASPVDGFTVDVEIRGAGALGAATFRYSLDGIDPLGDDAGGKTWSADLLIPSGGKFTIPNVGIVLTFASTFVLGDVYRFTTTAAGFTSTELNTAMTALIADARWPQFLNVVGRPASAAAAATIASAVDSKMTTAENAYRYGAANVECPSGEGDAAVISAFSSFTSRRVGVCVGDVRLFSPLYGFSMLRNVAWAVGPRISKYNASEDVGKVKNGALDNVTATVRDEEATPGLFDAGFTVATKITGKEGIFVAAGLVKTAAGSDYRFLVNRLVMDIACRVARQKITDEVNDDVLVDPVTGYIAEDDALSTERTIERAIFDTLIVSEATKKNASAVKVVLDREANLLSTGTQPLEIRIVPKAYKRYITATIGFLNPALA